MEEHIKLRLEYKKLVREGKKDKAMAVLKKVWALSGKSNEPKKVEESKESKPKEESKKKVSNITSLSDLVSISGFGKKALNDVEKQFDNIEDLKTALLEDKVALRDDIVEKLKEELI